MRSGRKRSRRKAPHRSGVVLLIVLVVVAMLALGAYSFVQLMNVEARGAKSYGRLVQAREAADSGVHYVAAFLQDQKITAALGTDLYDSSAVFNGQLVSQQTATGAADRSLFSVVAPSTDDQSNTAFRFGVMDESARINLNVLPDWIVSQSAGMAGSGSSGAGSASTGSSSGGSGSGSGTAAGGGGATGTGSGTGDASSITPIFSPLINLPNMTDEIADAILDWIDDDDLARPYGAESDYYQSLNPPYATRNAPLRTLDELLLVRGVTPRLLYGEDANHNGILDPNEDDGALSYPSDNADGSLDRGWLPFFTLFSQEADEDTSGLPRFQLNSQDLQGLYDQLVADSDFGEEHAKFIIAYRLFGPADANQSGGSSNRQNQGQQGQQNQQGQPQQGQPQQGQPQQNQSNQSQNPNSESGQGSSQSQETSTQPSVIAGWDASGGGKHQINSVIDLIGARVNAKTPGQQQTTSVQSPFQENAMAEYVDTLLDRTTTSSMTTGQKLIGRINVKTAPWAVLMAIPNMTEDMANNILYGRDQVSEAPGDMSDTGVGWLLTGGAVTRDEFKKIERYITGRSRVYRVQVVGYFDPPGPVARVEAVIDLSNASPRIRFWRDLTPHRAGFDTQQFANLIGQ